MNATHLIVAALVLLPAVAVVAAAWFVLSRIERAMWFLGGIDDMHFGIR